MARNGDSYFHNAICFLHLQPDGYFSEDVWRRPFLLVCCPCRCIRVQKYECQTTVSFSNVHSWGIAATKYKNTLLLDKGEGGGIPNGLKNFNVEGKNGEK